MQFVYKSRMTVAGHRGDWYDHYENTMESFQAAYAAGVDMIETDIHLSADDHAVLIHDDSIDRTTDRIGLVREFTLETLQHFNAGDPKAPAKIPTLEEFLQWAQPLELLLNLELKEYNIPGNEGRWERCADEAVRLVRKYGLQERMIFTSFDASVLDYVDRKYSGSFRLQGFYPYEKMRNVKRNPDEYLYSACLWGCTKKKAYYDYLLSKGIEPWVGASVTSTEALALCCEYGARLVTTNHPADTIEKLKKLGKRP